MSVLDPIPGQEEANATFLQEHGVFCHAQVTWDGNRFLCRDDPWALDYKIPSFRIAHLAVVEEHKTTPSFQESLPALRLNEDIIQEDKLFRGNLISTDGTAAVIVAEFDDRMTDPEIARRIDEIVGPERDESVTHGLGARLAQLAVVDSRADVVGVSLDFDQPKGAITQKVDRLDYRIVFED